MSFFGNQKYIICFIHQHNAKEKKKFRNIFWEKKNISELQKIEILLALIEAFNKNFFLLQNCFFEKENFLFISAAQFEI